MVALFPVVIEDMRVEDIAAVQLVENASFPLPWPANAFRHELTQNKNAHYIVAKEGEHIVGYAGLWLSLDEAHITTFAVLPDYRRRKIGERMLIAIVERAQVLARRDLGHNSTGVLMHELRGDDVRDDAPPVIDHGDARLVAGRLDREDPHYWSSSAPRSFATRSRTPRSRRRSVHMMIASSLLSE